MFGVLLEELNITDIMTTSTTTTALFTTDIIFTNCMTWLADIFRYNKNSSQRASALYLGGFKVFPLKYLSAIWGLSCHIDLNHQVFCSISRKIPSTIVLGTCNYWRARSESSQRRSSAQLVQFSVDLGNLWNNFKGKLPKNMNNSILQIEPTDPIYSTYLPEICRESQSYFGSLSFRL